MVRSCLGLAGTLLLSVAGCAPSAPPIALDYGVPAEIPSLVLTFAPNKAVLSPAALSVLHELRSALPGATLPELYASGPLVGRRAYAVRTALARPVIVYPADQWQGSRPASLDGMVLRFPVPAGIVPDACRGTGEFGPGGVWPGDDARRPRLLPPGCAVASGIAAQAAESRDLIQGRLLTPGAASPFADAVERYYRRNEPGQSGAPSSGGGQAPSGTSAPAADATGGNPLLGPLPAAAGPVAR